ncbi:hypothetical protein, partial [Burkholderia sp. SIMBA_062]
VLMHGYYVVPQWYSATHRVAYKNTLAYPSKLPLYYGATDWIISTWWLKSPAPSPKPSSTPPQPQH